MGLGLTSCNNDEFLDVTHYKMIEGDEMFTSDDHAIKGMTGCYDQLLPDVNDDAYKYWIFNGSHPTMDSQASGWDCSCCQGSPRCRGIRCTGDSCQCGKERCRYPPAPRMRGLS